ncbi:MAG: glutamine--tRNA ligase, partial [Candidatus Cloacimonetes bacterium]|nr:glutamine--tRNA ligase [Candidatus Cloacimonadota bacterium]
MEHEEIIERPSNFIRDIIDHDLETGKNGDRVATRFPPEPNGSLHIGHAKSICLNFGIAQDYKGTYNLRFDDTNPALENPEFVQAMQDDIAWLGYRDYQLHFASNYFEQLYKFAVQLVEKGKAYVETLSQEEMKEYRGTLTSPGKNSPDRERSVEENLMLFEKMRNGEIEEGKAALRAKIDMQSPNMNMRDPVIYRIKNVEHHRTNNDWCIYPMYDFTDCLSDMLEGITHSICTLEFEDHRPLYDWFLNELETPCHPQQIEFARLDINYTITSKRKTLALIEKGIVSGWDDPRLPTLQGLRRRGFTPASIRNFCDKIGVAKGKSIVDYALLVYCLREDLNKTAARVMAVLNPLKIVIENYPGDKEEWLDAINNPED